MSVFKLLSEQLCFVESFCLWAWDFCEVTLLEHFHFLWNIPSLLRQTPNHLIITAKDVIIKCTCECCGNFKLNSWQITEPRCCAWPVNKRVAIVCSMLLYVPKSTEHVLHTYDTIMVNMLLAGNVILEMCYLLSRGAIAVKVSCLFKYCH